MPSPPAPAADDLSVLLQRFREAPDPALELGKGEQRLDQEQVLPLPYALEQAVLFVLRQDLQHRRVDDDPGKQRGVDRCGRRGRKDLVDAVQRPGDALEGLPFPGLLHETTQDGQGVGKGVQGLAAHVDLAKPDLVQQELELVREVCRGLEPEHPGETLEGVDRAEQAVDLIGAGLSRLLRIIEGKEGLVRSLQDVLGLRQELLYGTVGRHTL